MTSLGKRHPAEMLLRILINGHRVEHDGRVYAMGEDGSLCVVQQRDGEEVGLSIDCDLRAFYKLAEDIGSDTLFLKCCELALSDLQRSRGGR